MKSGSTLFFILSLTTSQAWAGDFDIGQALLDGFGAECPSYGDFTKGAFRESKSLEDIILSLRSDDAQCSAIANELQKTKNYEDILRQVLEQSTLDRQIQGAASQVQDLTSNYLAETDPALRAATLSLLLGSNIQLSTLKSTTQTVKQTQWVDGISNFIQSAQKVSALLASEDKCFQKRPETEFQIAGEILSASAVIIAASAGTIYGGVAVVAGEIIVQTAKAIREAHFSKLLSGARSTKFLSGVGCALEATERQYCKAKDFEIIADSVANGVPLNQTLNPKWTALRLIQEPGTLYNEFIQRVVSGVPAQTPAQTVDRKSVLSLEHEIQIDREDFDGILSQAARQEAIADPGQLNGIRTAALRDLRFIFYIQADWRSSSNLNAPENYGMATFYGNVPFSLIFGFDVACGIRHYLYTGEFATSTLNNGYCPTYPGTPTIATLQTRVTELLQKTEEAVNDQKNQIMSAYSLQILMQCNVTRGSYLTPCDYLKQVKDYLDAFSTSGRKIPDYTSKQILELQTAVTQARQALTDDARGNPAKVLTTVQSLLAPRNDTHYLNTALKVILEWDLQDLKTQGVVESDIALLMAASREASITLLNQLGIVNPNMDTVNDQLATVKSNSLTQVRSLSKLFFKSYLSTAKDVDFTGAYKAEGCAQWVAAYPFLPPHRQKKLRELCGGTELVSVYNNRPVQPKMGFDQSISKSQNQTINCDLYRYRRANDILSIR